MNLTSVGLFSCALVALLSPSISHVLPNNRNKALPTLPKVADGKGILNKCEQCRLAVTFVSDMFNTKPVKELIVKFAMFVCKKKEIESEYVCKKIIEQFKDEVIYLVQKTVFSPDQICWLFAKDCGQPTLEYFTDVEWNITIPDGKPNVTTSDESGDTVRILHLSDIHHDIHYKEGAEADCDNWAMCCRDAPSKGETVKRPAGKWGTVDAACDIPYRTLENLFQHASATGEIDMIYWTGDLDTHADWEYNKPDRVEQLANLTQLFLRYFPNIPVMSALGNHEPVPIDNYAPAFVPAELGSGWLTDALVKTWGVWQRNDSQKADIKQRASFVARPYPGFRVISINTVYCDGTNLWMMLNKTDPDGVLSWFRDQLLEAELAGEKVHVIGHEAGGNCDGSFGKNYYKLINRFESTITAQMFGHSHSDSFKVFYEDMKYGRPTSIMYVGGSVTTYKNRQPSYRIYTMDKKTWDVTDHETYYMDVTEAQTLGPKWKLEYKATTDYNMPALRPTNWNSLINEMKTNMPLFDKFMRFKDRRPESTINCDHHCQMKELCDLRKAGNGKFCDDLGL